MEIYIVTHEHETDDPDSCYYEIVSAHLSREKAEKSVKKIKNEIISKFWVNYGVDKNTKVDHDFAGLFEIRNISNGNRDEILINTVTIKD